jgi:predicted TIM-barrel fold metal-dependent hydrolase
MTAPSRSYRLVDADSHINEPPNLWLDRVPAKFKDAVPRMKRFDKGDAWVMEGVAEPINFGNNASAPMFRENRSPWAFWEDISKGGSDPAVRLTEMDTDMVDAAVLYPTPRVSQLMSGTQDPALHLAMVQAYNDWLIEYASYAPDRLGALPMIPNRGLDQALEELERVAVQPGVAGVLIGCFPHGDTDIMAEDDPLWHAVAERDLALQIHVALTDRLPSDIYSPERITAARAAGDLRFLAAPPVMVQFLNSGVFERVPSLAVVLAEVDGGWVPYVKEQMDNRFRRRATGPKARFAMLPSEVIAEHFYYSYITDHYAISNRGRIGVDRLMWSSDYPHSGSDWPDSWRTIDADFANVPAAERDLILAGNALRIYRFAGR